MHPDPYVSPSSGPAERPTCIVSEWDSVGVTKTVKTYRERGEDPDQHAERHSVEVAALMEHSPVDYVPPRPRS